MLTGKLAQSQVAMGLKQPQLPVIGLQTYQRANIQAEPP